MTSATLAILAGGESRRMGRPKAELRVGEKPILEYLLDRFHWPGPTLLVTAPGHERPRGAERFDRETSDPASGEGPLRGVLTALEATTSEILVICSCDMPGIEGCQLTWLAETLAARPASTLLMIKRNDATLEPLPFAIRASALPLIRDHLTAGGRSLHSLSRITGASVVQIPPDWPASSWTNLNTPEELDEFLRDSRAQR